MTEYMKFAILFQLQRLMFWKKDETCSECGPWIQCYRYIHMLDDYRSYYRCPVCGKVICVDSLFE